MHTNEGLHEPAHQCSRNLYHFLDKFSRLQTDDIFSYFPQKTGIDISCKSNGDHLREMSNPIF